MPFNQAELDEMRAEREAMKEDPEVTLRAMVTTSSLRRPLVIAVMMMMAQQLSGINAAFFFSTSIFKSAGMEEGTAQVSPVSSICLNVYRLRVRIMHLMRPEQLNITGCALVPVVKRYGSEASPLKRKRIHLF